MTIEEALQRLGVSSNSTAAEIKAAWRDLASIYHPDRFSDPRMKAKVENELKEINAAYDFLREHYIPYIQETQAPRHEHRDAESSAEGTSASHQDPPPPDAGPKQSSDVIVDPDASPRHWWRYAIGLVAAFVIVVATFVLAFPRQKPVAEHELENGLPVGVAIREVQVKLIEAYVKTLDSLSQNRDPDFVFANLEPESATASWRPYKSLQAAQAAWDSNNFESASCIQSNGELTLVALSQMSESGDWVMYTRLYFGTDGHLVCLQSEMDFIPSINVSVRRDELYSNNGDPIKSSIRYFSLGSEREIPRPDESEFLKFAERAPTKPMSLSELPFWTEFKRVESEIRNAVSVAREFIDAAENGDLERAVKLCSTKIDRAAPSTGDGEHVIGFTTGRELKTAWSALRFRITNQVYDGPAKGKPAYVLVWLTPTAGNRDGDTALVYKPSEGKIVSVFDASE